MSANRSKSPSTVLSAARPASDLFAEDELPASIGKYQPIRRLGTGAMGVVFLCSQPGLDRPVAVKVMIAGRHASPEQILRFRREAWAAAQLTHPNVLQIHDVGQDGELNYFVMEYVDGWSLDRLIGSSTLTADRALRLIRQIAGALQEAHVRGIVHRDIKPSNILIHRSGPPKLADFGLAKALHDGRDLSSSGDIIGTPQYMAPEQALAAPEEIDGRADLYSLGAVLYELLCGKPPVDGPNALAALRVLIDEEPVPLRERNPAVPEELAAICRRAMAKAKEDRFASAAEFAEAIDAYLQGRPPAPAEAWPELFSVPRRAKGIPRRRWRYGLAAVAATAAGLVAFYAVPRPSADEDDPPEVATIHTPLGKSPAKKAGAGRADGLDPTTRVVAVAREMLQGGGGPRNLAGSTTPRDRLKVVIEDLTSALKVAPDDLALWSLRAQAYRRGGEFLAASDDYARVLRRNPKDLEAATGRLLSTYGLYILYLGNLNEPALRPHRGELMRDDIRVLMARGNAARRRLARLIDVLGRQDEEQAGRLAAEGRAEESPDVDLLTIEADALFRAAEAAYTAEQNAAEGEEKDKARQRRQQLARLANSTLRRGLDADPNHVGLLFLQADTFQRLAVWDTLDSEDRPTMIRRQHLAFEAALDRLRQTSLMSGCDAAIARAVLLSNFNRESYALERVNDALSYQPTVPYLHTFKAWLRLQAPPDGLLTTEEVDRVLNDYRVAFDRPQDDFNPYFVRALLHVAAGRWDEGRKDLRTCKHKLGRDSLPTSVGAYDGWFQRANEDSLTRYLSATMDVVGSLAVADEIRNRLAQEILKRLGNTQLVAEEKLAEDEVRGMKGWAHFRLAISAAAQNDRQGVLEHVREALGMKLADLTPKTFREDPTFGTWNEDAEFVALYKQHEGS
jgi:serine/threonine protein kinase